MSRSNAWETVIGLEIHAQLSTRSKLFSGAPTRFGAEPNAQACAIDLGFPGVLPVLNAEAVRMATLFGLAIGAEIAPRSVFARKNYFYPDLPKGYQISQYEQPIVTGGAVEIEVEDGTLRRIVVVRAHLEEDAGKSLHDAFPDHTGIDLNRAGVPLLEIVSAPDLRSATQAVAYMRKVHAIVRYLRICDGNMQEGSFRCDANVSVRPRGQTALGTRTELKNLNSFRFVERAIDYEVGRQIEILEDGGEVRQETRLYDPDRNQTRGMRGKEEANDYRYFPDPDLLPVRVPRSEVERLRGQLPELPDARRRRLETQYGLTPDDAALLTTTRELADYYEACAGAAEGADAKLSAHWVTGELLAALNRDGLEVAASPLGSERLAGLVRRIADGTVSGTLAKRAFVQMWRTGEDADTVIDAHGLRQVTDADEIGALVDAVLAAHPVQVAEFRNGSSKLLGFFVGQVMQRSGGKANPRQVNQLLREKLAPP